MIAMEWAAVLIVAYLVYVTIAGASVPIVSHWMEWVTSDTNFDEKNSREVRALLTFMWPAFPAIALLSGLCAAVVRLYPLGISIPARVWQLGARLTARKSNLPVAKVVQR